MTPPKQIERRSGASSQALANSDRLGRLIKITWIILAIYIAVAVTIASGFGVWNSIKANEHAAEAERLAREARNQARINGDIASNVKDLLDQQAPCLDGDPPTTPGCIRQARSDAVVAKAIADIREALTASVETHDLNVKAAHDMILRANARTRTTLPPRTPITAPPRTGSALTTSTVARTILRPIEVPTATTTTCPKRGNSEKCK